MPYPFPFSGTPVARLDYTGANIGSTALDDSGVLAGAWNGAQRKDATDLQVVDGARAESITGRALRVNLNRGDNPIGYGDRAEVQAAGQGFEVEGGEGWYTQSIYVPPNMPAQGPWTGWGTVAQHHLNADGSPPVGWYVDGGQLYLRVVRFRAPGVPVTSWGADTIRVASIPWSELVGKVTHLAWHVRWASDDSRGLVEAWRGTTMIGRKQVRTLVAGYRTYRKAGAYCESGRQTADPIVLELANMNSYAQVTMGPPPPTEPGATCEAKLAEANATVAAITAERDRLLAKLNAARSALA